MVAPVPSLARPVVHSRCLAYASGFQWPLTEGPRWGEFLPRRVAAGCQLPRRLRSQRNLRTERDSVKTGTSPGRLSFDLLIRANWSRCFPQEEAR